MLNKLAIQTMTFAVAVAALVITGCAHSPGGIAASTMPLDGREYRVVGPAKATDSHVKLLGILPIKGSNSIHDALKAAMRSRDADALIEVTVESYFQHWILFTREVIAVRGQAVQFERTRRYSD